MSTYDNIRWASHYLISSSPLLLLTYLLTLRQNIFFLGRKLLLFFSFQFNTKAYKLETRQALHTYHPVGNEMITLWPRVMRDNEKMKFLEYNSGEMRQSSSATLSVQVSHVITLAQIFAVTSNRHLSIPKCTWSTQFKSRPLTKFGWRASTNQSSVCNEVKTPFTTINSMQQSPFCEANGCSLLHKYTTLTKT